MTCDDFREWLETAGAKRTEEIPASYRAHSRSCATCLAILKEEQLWRRFFSAAPEPSLQRPAWPGVLARIREEESRRAALSDALLLFSRRLAPAFALVVFLLGGIGVWRDMLLEPQEQIPVTIAMLESASGLETSPADEPDAVLMAWVGARNP